MQTGLRRVMSTNIWRETSEGGRPFPPPRIGSAAPVSHHFPLLGKINYQEPRRQGEASGKKLKRGCRRRLPSGENRLRLHISSVAW